MQDFKAKERMDVDSRWAYFCEGTVVIKPPQVHVHADTLVEVPKLHNIRLYYRIYLLLRRRIMLVKVVVLGGWKSVFFYLQLEGGPLI